MDSPKIVTGIRHCGKSYLLKEIFKSHLISLGVKEEQFLLVELDDDADANLRNPLALSAFVREKAKGMQDTLYVVLDEIQRVFEIVNPELTGGQIVLAKKGDAQTISFVDAFLLSEASRYDMKGRSLIGAGRKYYFTDTGLRNARLNFGFPDIGQLMENAVYNELLYNGYQVSVGMVPTVGKDKDGKSVRKDYEIDFVARKGYEVLYVQICQSVADPNVLKKELRPFDFVRGEAKNILVIGDPIPETQNQDGTYVVGIADFLLGL